MKRFYDMLKSFIRAESGVAMIEFIFVMPLFLLLVLGGAELSRYILIHQKMDKAVYALGDVVAQSPPSGAGELTMASMGTIVSMLPSLMEPFDGNARHSAIITSLQNCPTQDAIAIRWQYAGGGTLSNSETISVINQMQPAAVSPVVWNTEPEIRADIADLLDDMIADENVIVSEVFYSYRPFLAEVLEEVFGFSIEARILTRRAFLRPRLGNLECLMPAFPCTDCDTPVNTIPTGGGGSCAAGQCDPNTLGGTGVTQPCECTANGATARAFNGGPNGCGRYRCNNGNWVFQLPLPCIAPPVCP